MRSIFLLLQYHYFKVVSLEPNFRLLFSQWAGSGIGLHKLDKKNGALLNSATRKSNKKENVYSPATCSNLKKSGRIPGHQRPMMPL